MTHICYFLQSMFDMLRPAKQSTNGIIVDWLSLISIDIVSERNSNQFRGLLTSFFYI